MALSYNIPGEEEEKKKRKKKENWIFSLHFPTNYFHSFRTFCSLFVCFPLYTIEGFSFVRILCVCRTGGFSYTLLFFFDSFPRDYGT